MPRIHWYGPRYGSDSTHDRVSHTYAVAGAVRLKAMEIAHVAAFLLDAKAQHRTGDAQITTMHWPSPGVRASTGANIDSYVLLEDPDNKRAAQGIENGHWYTTKDGKREWIEGLHVLKEASESV